MSWVLHHGDCREVVKTLPDCSVDAVVTDPPYELGFMGKKWDASGIAYDVGMWAECLRVLKPGGHLLAFGGTRTYHRMVVAIEDAGFEIRDSLHWVYGSGFPKSLDVSKAIDKAAGAEREVVGIVVRTGSAGSGHTVHQEGGDKTGESPITAPATDAAKQWEGWGTALKPAHEPIVLARKPLVGTVASNVLTHGTGALNIDGCRVAASAEDFAKLSAAVEAIRERGGSMDNSWKNSSDLSGANPANPAGRWPANVMFDTEAANELGPEARYFYVSKPSKRERNAGLDGLPERANHHPTVKPITLMRYLIRLVTPPGGTVLDPFAGSGTTLMAAVIEGFNCIGIEMTDEYLPIIRDRVAWAENQPQPEPQPTQQELF